MPNPDDQNNDYKGFIDPISLYLTGTTHEEANANGFKISPMDINKSFETNKEIFANNGGVSQEQYQQLYKEVYGRKMYETQAEYLNRMSGNTTTINENLIAPLDNKYYLVNPKILGFKHAPLVQIYKGPSTPGRINEEYNRFGKLVRPMNATQDAEIAGYYIKSDGSKGDIDDYKELDVMGQPFRIDENGNKKLLVLDPSINRWVEADSDSVQSSYGLRSRFGPQDAEHGIGENMAVQAWNTLIDQSYGSAGTVAEMIGQIGNWITGHDGVNNLQKWGREMQNIAGISKSKISEAVEAEGMFGSWRAGLGTAANALTQVFSQFLVGAITSGAGNILTGMAMGTKAAGAVGYLSKALNGGAYAFGAAYAAQAMNDEAKAAGLDDDSRAIMSMLAAGAMYASEMALAKMGFSGIADGFADNSLRGATKKSLEEALEKSVKEVKNALDDKLITKATLPVFAKEVLAKNVKEMSEKLGIDLTEKIKPGIMKNMQQRVANFQYANKPLSLVSRLKAMTIAGNEEGLEEIIEGGINSWTKYIYNERFANPDAEPGRGKFQNTKWENPLGEYAAGFIGGGAMGLARGLKKKYNIKDKAIVNLAVNMSEEDGEKFLLEMFNKGILGNPLLDESKNFIGSLTEDEQAKAKSLNDIAYETMREQLRQAHNIIRQTGLKDVDTINKLMGGDMDFVKDTLQNMLANKTMQQEIEQMRKNQSSLDPKSQEFIDSENKIKEKETELQAQQQLVRESLDGTAVDKYKALMLVKTLKAKQEVGQMENLTPENIDAAFNESIDNLQANDVNWEDRTKAQQTVKNIQNFVDERNKKKEEIEKFRNETKELDTVLKNIDFNNLTEENIIEAIKQIDSHLDGNKQIVSSQYAEKFVKMKNKLNELQELNENELYKNNAFDKWLKEETENTYQRRLAQDNIKESDLTDSEKTALRNESMESARKSLLNARYQTDENGDYNDDFDPRVEQEEELRNAYDEYEKRKLALQDNQDKVDNRETKLVDDRDKFFVKGNGVENFSGQDYEFTTSFNDSLNDVYYYTKRGEAGNEVVIKKEEFEEAKLKEKSKGDLFQSGEFVYKKKKAETKNINGVNYHSTSYEAEEKDDKGNVVKKQTIETRALDVTQAGKQLIEDYGFKQDIRDLISAYVAAKGEADDALINKAEETAKRIKERRDEALMLLQILRNEKYIPQNVRDYLGLKGMDSATFSDMVAFAEHLEFSYANTLHNIAIFKGSKDQREKDLIEHEKMTYKQMAVISNQLIDFMPQHEVVVDGKVMVRPSQIITSIDVNPVEALYAMSYWHHYFKTHDKAKTIELFKTFWHSKVENRELGPNGELLPTNKYKGTKNVSSSEQGMFVDSFKDFLNLENFENYEAANTFRQLAYYNYFRMIFNVDMASYVNDVTNHVFDEDTEDTYPGAHTSEQLLVLLDAYTHLTENKNINLAVQNNDTEFLNFHDTIKLIMKHGSAEEIPSMTGSLFAKRKLKEKDKPGINYQGEYNNKYIADNFHLITGSGGVGKTVFLVKSIIELATNSTHKGKKIVLVAPNENQVKSLQGAAVKAGLAPNEYEILVVNDFIKKQHEYQDALIIIDEVSLLSNEQKGSLYFNGDNNYINGKNVNIIPGAKPIEKTNTVFILGDEFQAPYSLEESYDYPAMSAYMQHSINITQVKRTSYKDIFNIQNAFRVEIGRGFTEAQIPAMQNVYYYYEDEFTRTGVKLEENEDDFFNDAKRVNSLPNSYVIVLDNASKQKAVSSGINADKIKVLQDIDNSPQGMTMDEVYVYIPTSYVHQAGYLPEKGTMPPIDYNKYMGVAVGRAKDFVSVYSKGITNRGSQKVDNINRIEKFSDDPDKEKNKKKELYAKYYGFAKSLGKPANTSKPTYQPNQDEEAQKEEEEKKRKEEEEAAEKARKEKEAAAAITNKNALNGAKTKDQELDEHVTKLNKRFVIGNKYMIKVAGQQYQGILEDIKIISKSTEPNESSIEVQYTIRKKDALNEDYEKRTIITKKFKHTSLGVKIVEESVVESYPLLDTDDENAENINEEKGGIGVLDPELNNPTNVVDNIFGDGTVKPLVYNGYVFQVGQKYPVKINGIDRFVVIEKIEKIGDDYQVRLQGEIKPVSIENLYESIRKEYNPKEEIGMDPSEKSLMQLFHNQQVMFSGRFVTIKSMSATDEINPKKVIAQRLGAIGRAQEFSSNIRYRIVSRKADTTESFYSTTGDKQTGKLKYILELQYETDSDVYETVSEIHLTEDSDSPYYKLLYEKVDAQIKTGNNLLHEGNMPVGQEFVQNSLISRSSRSTNYTATAIINELTSYGFSHNGIVQENYTDTDGTTKTRTVINFVNNAQNLKLKIELDAITLGEMSTILKKDYADYLNDIINDIKNTQGEEALKTKLGNLTTIGFLGYNASQLFSDSQQSSIPDYYQMLDNEGLIVDDNKQPKKKKIVYDANNIQKTKNDIIAALEIIRDFTNNSTKLRVFPPMKSDGSFDSQYYKVYDSNLDIKTPVILAQISPNQDGSGLLRSNNETLEKLDNDQSLDEAIEEWNTILGTTVQPDFVEGLQKREGAHGKITKLGKVLLDSQNGFVSSKAMQHEIAHYVMEFLVKEDMRRAVYEEVARKNGIKNFDYNNLEHRRQAAEFFALKGERFKSDRRNLKGMSKMFRQVLDYIMHFLDNIGLYRNLTHRYMYDIYVKNKFRNFSPDTSDSAYQKEMPYQELLRADSFKEFSYVENFYGDNDIARRSADFVAHIAAKQIVLPAMNRRMFMDEYISFKDITNRIDNSMRLQVMYQIEPTGNIAKYERGHEFEGQFKLRTDANGNTLMVSTKTNDQGFVELFKYINTNVAGSPVEDIDGKKYNGIVFTYWNEDKKKYIKVPTNKRGIMFGTDSERIMIRNKMREALGYFKLETGKINEETKGKEIWSVFDKDGKAAKARAIKNDNIPDYQEFLFAAGTLNDNIFAASLNKFFPNVEIHDLLSKKNYNIRYSELIEKLMEQEDIISKQNHTMLNPMDKQSHMLKFILMTLPKYFLTEITGDATINAMSSNEKIKYANDNGYFYSENKLEGTVKLFKMAPGGYGEVLNPEKVFKVLEDVAMTGTWTSANGTIADFQAKVNARMRMIEMKYASDTNRTQEQKNTDLLNDETYNILNAINENFFSVKKESTSHFKIVKWNKDLNDPSLDDTARKEKENTIYDQYLKTFNSQKTTKVVDSNETPLTKDEFIESIKNASDKSNKILNAIISYFNSIGTDTYVSARVKFAGTERQSVRVTSLLAHNTSRKKIELESKIARNIQTTEGSLESRFLKLFGFNPENKQINPATDSSKSRLEFHRDGLYYIGEGTKIPMLVIKNGNLVNVNYSDVSVGVDFNRIVTNTLKDTMIPFNNKTIKQFSERQKDDKVKSGWDNFHNVFGPLILSTYTYVASKNYNESNMPDSVKAIMKNYMQALDNFSKNQNRGENYGKIAGESLDNILSSEIKEGESLETADVTNDDLYHPNGFYLQLEEIAKIIEVTENGAQVRFARNAKDQKIFLDTVQDTVAHNLKDDNSNKGLALRQNYNQALRNGQIPNNINHTNGIVYNPYYSEDASISTPFVIDMPYINGVFTSFGYELSDLSKKNNYDLAMMFFMDGHKKGEDNNWKFQNNLIFRFNEGERGLQRAFRLDWSKNGFGQVNFSNGLLVKEGGKYKIDSDNILHHLTNVFRIFEKAQVTSLNKWVNFVLTRHGGGVSFGSDEKGKPIVINSDSIIDTNQDGWRAKRNKVLSAMVEYSKQSQFNFAGDDIVEFDGFNFRRGIDYNIVTLPNGTKKVYLGHDTTMYDDTYITGVSGPKRNPSRVYNRSNYKKRYTIKNKINGEEKKSSISIEQILEAQDIQRKDPNRVVTDNNIYYSVEGNNFKLTSSQKAGILYKIFANDLNITHKKAVQFGYFQTKKQLENLDIATMTTVDNYYGIKVGKRYQEHWAAYSMAHNIFNAYTSLAFEGTFAQEMDNNIRFDKNINWTSNNNKRQETFSSPMMKPTIGGETGLSANGYTIIIGEILMNNITLEGLNTKEFSKHSVFDGQSFENPLKTYIRYRSGGSEYGSMPLKGMVKSLAIDLNPETGQSNKHKQAKAVPSAQSMIMFPAERKMFEIMLNPNARKYIPTLQLFDLVKRHDSIPAQNDSLYQRYLVYELESSYYTAVKSMMENIDNFDKYVETAVKARNPVNDKDKNALIQQYKSDFKNGTEYTKHQILSELMDLNDDNDLIEEPKDFIDFDYAMNKLTDYYLDQRKKGNDIVYAGQIAQNKAVIKDQTIGNTMPLDLGIAGKTNNVRTAENGLRHLATNEGVVPTDLFTMYDAHLASEFDLDHNKYLTPYNEATEGVLMNANRDIDDTSEAPITQLMNIILASPEQHINGQAPIMMNKIAETVKVALEQFKTLEKKAIDDAIRKEENAKIDENDVIRQFIKEKISTQMSSIDDKTMLSTLIKNDKIEISVGAGMETRVYQFLASFFRKEAVKRKQSSLRVVQSAGNHAELYELTLKDGTVEVFNQQDALRYANRVLNANIMPGDNVDEMLNSLFKKRTLKHTTISQSRVLLPEDQKRLDDHLNSKSQHLLTLNISSENLQKELSKERMRWMIQNDFTAVDQGEIILPSPKFEKYSIPKHTSINQLFRIYSLDENGNYIDNNLKTLALEGNRYEIKKMVEDLFNSSFQLDIVQKPSGKRIIKYGYNNLIKKGDNVYMDSLFGSVINAWIKTNKSKMDDMIKKAKTMLTIDQLEDVKNINEYLKVPLSQLLLNEINNPNSGIEFNSLFDTYADGLVANALFVKEGVGVRTPSGPGSGFINTPIQFVNDNGSVGYVNTIKNLIDGSDQDIDQFNYYYTNDTYRDLGYTPSDVNDILNKKKNKDRDTVGSIADMYNERLDNINNDMMVLLYDYMKNPKNNYYTGSPIDLESIQYVAEKEKAKMFADGDSVHNFGISIDFRIASFDGQAVGPFAQGNKSWTNLAAAYWMNNEAEGIFNLEIYPLELSKALFIEKPAVIEGMTNNATDNKKLQNLGALNINFINADMVTAIAIAPSEIMAFIKKHRERFNIGLDEFDINDPDVQNKILNHFYTGQAMKDIMSYIESNKDVLSSQYKSKKLLNNAFSYYKYLNENTEKNNKELNDLNSEKDRIESQLRSILQEFGLTEQETAGKNFFQLKDMIYASNKPNLKVWANLLLAEANNQLEEQNKETAKDNIKQIIQDSFKVQDIYSKLDDAGIITGTMEDVINKYNEKIDSIAYFFERSRELLKTNNKIERISKKTSEEYKEEVFLIAKYAMLGEWSRGAIKIFDIDQFKVTSQFEALDFMNNFKRMTGRDISEVINIYENYRSELESNPALTAIEYLTKTNQNLDATQLFENDYQMNKHEYSRGVDEHIFDSISFGDKTLDYKKQFHSIANMTALLISMPHVMEKIKILETLENYADILFINRRPDIKNLLNTLKDNLGIDMFNETKYNEINDSLHDYHVSMFVRSSERLHTKLSNALAKFNKHDKPLIGIDNGGIVTEIKTNQGRDRFVKEFPEYFRDILLPKLAEKAKETDANGNLLMNKSAIKFINDIEISQKGNQSYLVVSSPLTDYDNYTSEMREGFKSLPEEYRDLISIYTLVLSTLDYKRGFFSKIMPEEYYEMYSEYIKTKFNDRLSSSTSESLATQIISDPNKKIPLRAKKTWDPINRKMLFTPPTSANGIAMYDIREVFSVRNKFGRKAVEVISKNTIGKDIIAVYAKANNLSNNHVPVNEILDIDNSFVSKKYSRRNFSGGVLNIEGLSLKAYMHYFIKGNMDKLIDNAIKNDNKVKANLSESEIFKYAESLLNIEEFNKNAFKPTSKVFESAFINKEKETNIESSTKIQNEWTDIIREMLIEKYGDNLNVFVNDLIGKQIATDTFNNIFSPAFIISRLFSNGLKSGNVSNYLRAIKGFPEEVISEDSSSSKTFKNRNVQHRTNYNFISNEESIVEIRNNHDNFFDKYFPEEIKDSTPRKGIERFIANAIRQSFYLDTNGLINYFNGLQGGDLITLASVSKSMNLDPRNSDDLVTMVNRFKNELTQGLNINITTKRMGEHTLSINNRSTNTFSVTTSSRHMYQIGDIIHFSDGNRGVVTSLFDPVVNDMMETIGYKSYSYALDPSYNTSKTKIFKAVTSLEGQIRKNNSQRVLESAVRLFARSMPNIEYKFIDNQQAFELGEVNATSFFKDGIVYINLDRADEAVALHEFAHPFVFALEETNPELYNKLVGLILNNEEVLGYIRNNYPEIENDIDLIREAIPTYLQMRMYKRMHYEQSSAERQAWQEYFDWVSDTFIGAMAGTPNIDTSLNNLDIASATLNDIADAIINDFKAGRVLSQINTSDIKHMVPYSMKASTSSKLKNINLTNLDSLFQVRGDTSETEEARSYVSYIINKASANFDTYNGASGTYNFSMNNKAFQNVDGSFNQQAFDKMKSDAIKNEIDYYEKIENKVLDFLYDISNDPKKGLLSSAMEHIYKSWDKRYNIKNMTNAELEALQNKVENMLLHIGYNRKTDRAMNKEQLEQYFKIKLPNNINTNAMFIVHDIGKPAQAISVLTITNRSLTGKGLGDTQTLGEAFTERASLSSKEKRQINQVSLVNTNQDIQSVKNSILAMAIVKENPTLKIRKVGSVKITSDGYKRHFKRLEDMVVPMKNLFNVKYIKENLETDLYDIVSNETLMDENTYKRDPLESLKDYVNTELAQTSDLKDKKYLQEMIDTIAHVQSDQLQAKAKMLNQMVRSRLTYLRNNVYGNNLEKLAKSEEYQELADIYLNLSSYNDYNVKKVTPIDMDEMWLKTADRWNGQVRTWVFDSLDLAMRKSKNDIMPFQQKLNELVATLNKANPTLSKVSDASHKLFQNLFKKIRVKDENGVEHEVSTHEIHWNENDSETRKALNSGQLSLIELEMGKWLADNLYNEFVDYILDVERSSIAKSAQDTEETLRKKAEAMVNIRYRKGMMPVFTQSFGSALSEGKIGEAVKLFTDTAGSWYGGNIYTDYQQSDDELQKGSFHELKSPFWNQFSNATEMGSSQRMSLLGLGIRNGEVILLNKKRYDSISYNLQNIGLFTKAASTRSRHMKEGIANVNIAMDILRGEQETKGIKTDDIIKQIENYVNRQVYGNMPVTGKLHLLGAALNVDNFLDASGKFIHMVHLAVNPVLGAKNAMSATIKMFTNSLLNAFSGSNMFKPDQLVKAATEVINNPKKVQALNRKYQLVNITERDLLNHFTNNLSRANMTETDYQMVFHWFGDHYTQLIGAMAQMMEDGTYDAHDNEGNYDEALDTRFQDADGQLIKLDIARRQLLENYNLPLENGKLTHAYSQRDENAIKVHVQRYIGELTDNQFKNMASSFGLARAVMSLKNWVYNVKQHYYSKRAPDVFIGKRKVINGKVVHDPVMTEGVFNTISYLIRTVRTGEKLELDTYRKRNIGHFVITLGVISAVYFIVDALTEGFDDDDDKRTNEDESMSYPQRLYEIIFSPKGYNIKKDQADLNYAQRLLRYVLGGAANENLSYMNPAKLYNDMVKVPTPYLWQIENLAESFAGTLALPFEIYENGLGKAVDEWTYQVSRTIPYGSNYRLIHDAITGILNDYERYYTKQ